MALAAEGLQVTTMITGLGGGLALFLYGMRKMTDALKTVAGRGMKTLLAKLTTNRFTGMLAGALVTAVVQSSSVTTVLVVGFITAELMTFVQSIGIIIGANIGTTITAQIIAFKVTKYSLVMIGIGFLMEVLTKNQKVRHYGVMLMGLGMIFLGMQLMSDATQPLRSYEPFIDIMKRMSHPLLGIAVGALFTALVQSSSATTGIVIVLASQGFITLEAGIALIFGANIGTCATAMLSAIGKPRRAIQASIAHVVFNLLGVLLWVAFIPPFAEFVRSISPATAGLSDTARLAAEVPRQIANAHTLFNIGNALLFIWFVGPMARLIQRILPEQVEVEAEAVQPKYLDDFYLQSPETALDQVRLELGHLGSHVLHMAHQTMPTVLDGTEEQLAEIARMDDVADALHKAIVNYLGKLSLVGLANSQPVQISEYLAIANYLENLSDVLEDNLLSSGRSRIQHRVTISESTREVLAPLYEKGCWALDMSLAALVRGDNTLALSVIEAEDSLEELADHASDHLARRLIADAPNRLETFRLESDLVENLKRVFYLAKRIAEVPVHNGNELRDEGASSD